MNDDSTTAHDPAATGEDSRISFSPGGKIGQTSTIFTNEELATAPNALKVGREPRRAPAARPVLVLLSLALLGLAVFAGYELYATLREGWTPILGPWVENGLDGPLSWRPLPWVAGAVAVIGLLMLISALRRRQRSHVGYGEDSALWLTPTSIARLCSQHAGRVSGVTGCTTVVGRKKVVATVHAGGRDLSDVELAVRQELAPIVGSLAGNKTLVVRTRGGENR